jgi:hypothetical protein
MKIGHAMWLGLGLLGSGPAVAQSVTVALKADIRGTNPGVNRDDDTDAVTLHMVEGLVAYREGGTVGPLLAEKVDLSEDGRTYTFRLRKGVKFHNGADMTSADVVWSWNRYMDPKIEWRCLSEFDGRGAVKVEAVEAPDPHTVTMRISKPNALFLDSLARTDCGMAAVIHKDSLNPDGSWKAPVGTGPFRFGEWKRGQEVVLTRFDGYVSPPGEKRDGFTGQKKALVQEARFLVVPDSSTVKAGLESGRVDIAEIVDSDIPELEKSKNVKVLLGSTGGRHAVIFQTTDPRVQERQDAPGHRGRDRRQPARGFRGERPREAERLHDPFALALLQRGAGPRRRPTIPRGEAAPRGGRLQGRKDQDHHEQPQDRAELQHRGRDPGDAAAGRGSRRHRRGRVGDPHGPVPEGQLPAHGPFLLVALRSGARLRALHRPEEQPAPEGVGQSRGAAAPREGGRDLGRGRTPDDVRRAAHPHARRDAAHHPVQPARRLGDLGAGGRLHAERGAGAGLGRQRHGTDIDALLGLPRAGRQPDDVPVRSGDAGALWRSRREVLHSEAR